MAKYTRFPTYDVRTPKQTLPCAQCGALDPPSSDTPPVVPRVPRWHSPRSSLAKAVPRLLDGAARALIATLKKGGKL